MRSWKSTLGGSLSSLGTALIGVGVVPQLQGMSSPFLTHVAVAGFFIDAIGKFFAHLFAADVATVQEAIVQNNIAQGSPSPTETTTFRKP